MQDPRFLNKTFNQSSIQSYFSDYINALSDGLKSVSTEALDSAHQLMRKTRKAGGRIFSGGNGGSSSISEHLCCDWMKGTHLEGKPSLKVQSMTSNVAILTAIGNDRGYDQIFSYQLEMAGLAASDLVVLVSSSGNSPNIVKAAEYAKSKGTPIIGLTGFSGGKLKGLASVSLHVAFENYGLVEDAHQVLMHNLAQFHDLESRKGN